MLKISFEFRKGILFLRLIGDLSNKSYKEKEEEIKELIITNRFKYIVINTNYLERIDLDGLNYIMKIFYMTRESKSNLVICDKFDIFGRLLKKNIPSIKTELDLL